MAPSSIEDKKFVSCKAEKRSMALQKAIVSANAAVVFSKSYCPYRVTLKQLLQQHGATFKAIELDNESDGSEIQAALAEWTRQRRVPNVFIGG